MTDQANQSVGWGTARNHAIISDSGSLVVVFELSISDPKRRQVMLSKALDAIDRAEYGVEQMNEASLDAEIERISKHTMKVLEPS